jgi:hypothetical protein
MTADGWAGFPRSQQRRSWFAPLMCRLHGDSRAMTDRIPRTMHQNAFQLTQRYGPLLCKAVLRPLSGTTPASAARSIQNMPSPGGQDSGMADTGAKPPARWVGWVRHPADLPQGLPHATPGAEPRDARTGLVEAAPGLPCGRAGAISLPTRCPTVPASRSSAITVS